jgi:20S proteasome alpha/beta subunit
MLTPKPHPFRADPGPLLSGQFPSGFLRKAVTIVAGFDFSGGVLVCADTEMTDQIQKFQSSKLMTYTFGGSPKVLPDRVVFALSGNVPYAKRAIALCANAVSEASLQTPNETTNDKIQDCIETTLLDFHNRFIFSHPLYRESAAPIVELIIGIFSHVTGRASLLSTNECAVNEVHGFDFVGQGSSFARYVAQLFWRERLTEEEAYLLAAHVLQQTKQHAPNCGKRSEFMLLKHGTGEMIPVWGLQTSYVENYSDQYMRLFGSVFFELSDSAKSFEQAIEHFTPHARGLWSLFRTQKAAYEHIAKGVEDAQKEKADKAKAAAAKDAIDKPKQGK